MNWNEYFNYDPLTGILVWKNRPLEHFKNKRAWIIFNSVYAGKVAGAKAYTPAGNPLAVAIGLKTGSYKKDHTAHRIAWEIVNGPIPKGMEIDHINGNAHDNRITNLRLATHQQNMLNRRMYRNNTSGHKGFSYDKSRKKWSANIQVARKSTSLGRFDSIEDAITAYAKASQEKHGQFARVA